MPDSLTYPLQGDRLDKSLNIYVCSTYRDLVSERNAVAEALDDIRFQYPSLSWSCPRSIQPLETCKEEIGRADVMVLILGHLYGVIAPGLDIAHGEAEYNEGLSAGKTILVYFRDDSIGLYPAHFERDRDRLSQLKRFKERLRRNHDVKTFTDLQSLVVLVSSDITRMAREGGLAFLPGSRTGKLMAKGWETRKFTNFSAPAPEARAEGEQGAYSTRTIPMLQKALATPFKQTRTAIGGKGRVLILTLVLALGAIFALVRIYRIPIFKKGEYPSKLAAGTNQSDIPLATQPAQPPLGAGQSAGGRQAAAKAAAARESGKVELMDDTDTNKAFIRNAQNGSRDDQMRVAQMYEEGKEIPRNDTLALRWYKKAAEQGLSEAQYRVGLMYRAGQGAQKSSGQAARWFQAAAEQGHSKAQFKLGQLYQAGKGVPRNETTAFKWFLKAADQKDPDAQKMLAELKESE